MTAQEAVIVDVDGTLVDVSGIRHYVTADPNRRDFNSFHKASALCPPVKDTFAWVDGHRELGRAVIVVTARERKWEFLTRRWLRKWGFRNDGLFMRATGDQRPDGVVKQEILDLIRRRGFTVVAAIDDNPSVVKVWEAEGIPVTVVPGWPDED